MQRSMTSIRGIELVILLSLALLLPSCGSRFPSDPESLILLLTDENKPTRKATSKALVDMGETAIPHLIDALNAKKWRMRESVAEVLSKIGSPAVPHLFAAVKESRSDSSVRVDDMLRAAVKALRGIGPAALSHLIEALGAEEAGDRTAAALALALMGQDAAPAAPNLIAALEDEHKDVRRFATSAVVNTVTDAGTVIPLMIGRTKDTHEDVRAKAAVALGAIALTTRDPQAAAPRVLPHLVESLGDDSRTVRFGASHGFRDWGATAVPHLVGALDHQEAKIRARANGTRLR